MTTWHWIRHGPTHEKAFVGWRDVPADLSDTAQIGRLSAHLPEKAWLVSSDLIRASATADALSGSDRTRLTNEPRLREFNLGAWDGLLFADVAARDPVLSRQYWEEPGDNAAPDGESWNAAARRINAVVDEINAAYPEAHIIAVAHIGVILTQVQRAQGSTAKEALSHTISNLSVTTLQTNAARWDVRYVNHLP